MAKTPPPQPTSRMPDGNGRLLYGYSVTAVLDSAQRRFRHVGSRGFIPQGPAAALGTATIERLKSALEIDADLQGEEENAFNTLGGFVMHMLGRIPSVTDHFESDGLRFEVMDMDKNRVDKVLVGRLLPLQDATEAKK